MIQDAFAGIQGGLGICEIWVAGLIFTIWSSKKAIYARPGAKIADNDPPAMETHCTFADSRVLPIAGSDMKKLPWGPLPKSSTARKREVKGIRATRLGRSCFGGEQESPKVARRRYQQWTIQIICVVLVCACVSVCVCVFFVINSFRVVSECV